MSSTFQTEIYQKPRKSLETDNGDLKQVVLNHTEANNGITFEGNSNISVENSNDVVIGTLTQFMGPVTIMQQNSLKKPLRREGYKEIPSICKFVPAPYVDPPSKILKSPLQFCKKHRRSIACSLAIAIPIILILIGLILSVNISYHEWKELEEMESSTSHKKESISTTQADILFRNTAKYVMISHSNGRQCDTKDKCGFTVDYHQNFHSHSQKYGNPNFAHNFFIGGDGYFYLDQGWNVKNNVSDNNIEFCFMGNFNNAIFTTDMISCAKGLIKFGIKLGVIAEDYILVAHNQTYNNTDSPGRNAFAEIKTWPHWKAGFFPDA